MKSAPGYLYIILTLTLINIPDMNGQNDDYKLIRSNYMVFQDEEGEPQYIGCFLCGGGYYAHGIRVDSTSTTDSSTTYYLNQDVKAFGYSGFSTTGSLLGDSVVEYSNGNTSMFNETGIEMVIPPNMQPGDSTVFFLAGDSLRIILFVQSLQIESFSGMSDSVKTFRLQWYDGVGQQVEPPTENNTFKVSKNYGLIRFVNFRDLPYDDLYGYPSLVLISSQQVEDSAYFYTLGDIYDYEPGDEFQFRVSSNNIYAQDSYLIRRILDRQDNPSTNEVTYTIWQSHYGEKYLGGDPWEPDAWGWFNETGEHSETYSSLDAFVLMPQIMPMEPILKGEGLYTILMYRDPDKYNGRYVIQKYGVEAWWSGTGENGVGYYYGPFDSYSGTKEYFIVGIGSYSHFWQVETSEDCFSCEVLHYYKKGDETWGTPIVGVEQERLPQEGMEVFPNPASRFITISSGSPFNRVALLNQAGQVVMDRKVDQGLRLCLDVSGLEPGMYLLVAETKTGERLRGKLMITR